MPIWFILFIAVCASFALFGAIRGIKGGMTIGGQTISPAAIVVIMIGILIGFGLLAAVQFGLITDHAP
jgi:hypothetical protein